MIDDYVSEVERVQYEQGRFDGHSKKPAPDIDDRPFAYRDGYRAGLLERITKDENEEETP